MWMNESHIDMVINVTELRMPFLRDHVKRGCIKQWEEYILLKHITFFFWKEYTLLSFHNRIYKGSFG